MGDVTRFRTCSIEGCERKHFARGWCELHYSRWYRKGTTEAHLPANYRAPGTNPNDVFHSRVSLAPTGCWLWTGSHNKTGYGYLHAYGGLVLAHRFSYMLHKGPIPDGLFVCHACDVRDCVNPDHLWLGTQTDNMHDASVKGRLPHGSGHRDGMSDDQVALIRSMVADGRYFREAAAAAGCSLSAVSRIINGSRHAMKSGVP